MATSNGFSIYLLKNDFTPEDSLKEEHKMVLINEETSQLPEGALFYLADNPPKSPWWKKYWGISKKLQQVQKGAIVFIPVKERWVALTFGMAFHQLIDNSYEYDFGLRTTLNALDPERIKSTDVLEPESAKRERIQSPTASNLTFFDINQDESIVKRLTGAVKDDYTEWFTNVSGDSSLRITSKIEPGEIINLCNKLITIYGKEDYLKSFPEIRNIVPIKDPDKIIELNEALLESFLQSPLNLALTIPEIVDYSTFFKIKYSGAGKISEEYDEVNIEDYMEYLKKQGITEITDVEFLYKHRMVICDENGYRRKEIPIYKCLLFDCQQNGFFHFCDGSWYQIEANFIQRLQATLNPLFMMSHAFLNPCEDWLEDEYNKAIAGSNKQVICLDKTNMSPRGLQQIEPCDLIAINEGKLEFVHVKISTRSSNLSHLFNQGYNSVLLLRMENKAKDQLKKLLGNDSSINSHIDKENYSVTFGIITKKERSKKADALPIFSQISLYRIVNGFKVMNIPCSIYLIDDNVIRKK